MTSIENNVAMEIKMLKSLIASTKEQIEMMIDSECYDGIDEVRREMAIYEADLARYE